MMEPVAHGITYLQCQKPSGASPEGNKEMIRSSPVYTPDRWCDIVSCHGGDQTTSGLSMMREVEM